MVPPPTWAYRRYQSVRLLRQAETASLPEREGLFREVVLLNLGMANAIAQHYARGRPAGVLQQVALAGLDKGVRTFDAHREHNFLAHVKAAITEEVRQAAYPPRVFQRAPRHLDGLALRIVAVLPELVQESGHSPRASDLACRLQADVNDVIEVLATDGRPASVRQPFIVEASCA